MVTTAKLEDREDYSKSPRIKTFKECESPINKLEERKTCEESFTEQWRQKSTQGIPEEVVEISKV